VLGATRGLARFLDLKSCVIFFLHMPFSFRDRAELPFQPLYPDALGLPKWPDGPKARTTRRRRELPSSTFLSQKQSLIGGTEPQCLASPPPVR
jgi:hypothetical protein